MVGRLGRRYLYQSLIELISDLVNVPTCVPCNVYQSLIELISDFVMSPYGSSLKLYQSLIELISDSDTSRG